MDVDLEGEFPFLVGDVLDRFECRLMSCIVDEDVDAAEAFDCLLDDRLAVPRGLDIAGNEHCLSARLLDETLCFLRVIMFAQIGDDDVCAFPGVGYCDCAPNAA